MDRISKKCVKKTILKKALKKGNANCFKLDLWYNSLVLAL